EARQRAEQQHVEDVAPRVALRVLDLRVVALEGRRVGLLLCDDLVETVAGPDLHPGRRGERPAGDQRPQLDELVRGDVERTEDRLRAGELDVTAHVHGMPPATENLPRSRLR